MVMNLGRKEFPQQSTRDDKQNGMKPESGQVNWVVGLFPVLFVAVLLLTTIQAERFRTISLYIEDALAASNLASALVDLEEYGISHRIQIADPEEAYGIYCEALKQNLNLNAEWQGKAGSVIAGPISVENYIVYNVDGDKVWIHQFRPDGGTVREEYFGTVRAPNGNVIESSSVYSEICFTVNVVPGIRVQARKGKLVDVIDGSSGW